METCSWLDVVLLPVHHANIAHEGKLCMAGFTALRLLSIRPP
jgi:hypothetical protein